MLSDEKLSAYLDGDLNDAECAEVDAALAADPTLATRLSELEELREALTGSSLLGPGRDLWAAIEEEVKRPRWWELNWVRITLPLSVAAAAALALVLWTPAPEAPKNDVLAEASDTEEMRKARAGIEEARGLYLSAIRVLEERADRFTASLPEEERLKLKTSLFEVDQAIARVEGVLHAHPDDVSANTTLVALYDQKVRVLKSTVEVAQTFVDDEREVQ
ncbi:MAG: zf-HC2 domain-containing protein [Myxococcota bacterium]